MPIRAIEGILFEPVGCLAEFPAGEFCEIVATVFGRHVPADTPASRAYWTMLDLLESGWEKLGASERAAIERCETRAVDRASPYDDVAPALSELSALGVRLVAASSLSKLALARFIDSFALGGCFADVWSRDTAGGVKRVPLDRAVSGASQPDCFMYLTDTAEGLATARAVGVNAILMMNDPDEAMKLTAHSPAGGLVSLHELPDFVRLVASR